MTRSVRFGGVRRSRLASGGTTFFPQSEGTLSRGVFGSVGAGVDFEL